MTKKILSLALFALIAAGCQQEENTLAVSPSGITPASPLSSLLSRVSQNATALDNILDQSSCFSVNLPVTVIANGQQVTVNDVSGYGAVADIFNQSANDVDSVTFIYPISITYQNFQQQQIGSPSELQNAISQCANDDGLEEIWCVSIQYPVTINSYDTTNQQVASVTVQSDAQLFNFLQGASQMVLELVYPVTVSVSGQNPIPVNGNAQLSELIESAIGTCEVWGGGGPAPADELDGILVTGTWYVSYYYHNEDETQDYAGYTFTFSANGLVSALKNGITYNGTWDAHLEGSTQMLDLDFTSSNLGDLDDDWRVLEFNGQIIRLRQDGGGSDPDRLEFSKL